MEGVGLSELASACPDAPDDLGCEIARLDFRCAYVWARDVPQVFGISRRTFPSEGSVPDGVRAPYRSS